MLAQPPPMGWNSWNTFGRHINADVVKSTADLFIKLGLDKAGYQYVVIDDCWSKHDRDPETHRIVADPEKFPNGMKDVADYVHSKGLKFGMYSCAGVRTCGNYPGSFDHEFLDAKTCAEFGVDFLKYDFCFKPAQSDGPILYRRMGQALRTCGREILFSACNWGCDDVWSWVRSAGVHMYRSTGDIADNFKSFTDIMWSQTPKGSRIDWHAAPDAYKAAVRAAGGSAANAPGCWNDTDMLTVGMFGKGNVGTSGCNAAEYRMQFSLWCMMSAPLMLGCDLRAIDEETLALITNPRLIAINQDPEGRPMFLATRNWGQRCVFAKLLAGGDIAIGFFNFDDADNRIPLYVEDLGLPDRAGFNLHIVNVLTGEDLGTIREYMDPMVPRHDCLILRATPVPR